MFESQLTKKKYIILNKKKDVLTIDLVNKLVTNYTYLINLGEYKDEYGEILRFIIKDNNAPDYIKEWAQWCLDTVGEKVRKEERFPLKIPNKFI